MEYLNNIPSSTVIRISKATEVIPYGNKDFNIEYYD